MTQLSLSQALAIAVEHHRAGRLSEAESIYRQILDAVPFDVETRYQFGTVLSDLGDRPGAVEQFQRALQLDPQHVLSVRAMAHFAADFCSRDVVLPWCERLVSLLPSNASAHLALGDCLLELGRITDAERTYQRSLQCDSQRAEAHTGLAVARLLQGDFDRGWQEYEWRFRTKDYPHAQLPIPAWDGSPLPGKRIFLHYEQGLGDTLQLVRYALILKQQGATVILGCQPALARLFEISGVVDQVVTGGDVSFEAHAPLMSLPRIMGTTVETIPANVPYLTADAALVDCWRRELAGFDGYKIGIAWQGNPKSDPGTRRAIPLAHFAALARVPGVRLFSLQKGLGTEQLASAGFPIVDFGERLDASGPFMDTAALMKNMDLVVTSDTSIPHLAGAMGVPIWLPLSFSPDWRWMLVRTDSPWYPTLRLFRQKTLGDWAGVMREVADSLRAELSDDG